jgi:hypothetical protein
MSREKVDDWSEKHRRNLYLYLEKGPGIREIIFFSERAKSKPKYFSQSKFLSLEQIGGQGPNDVQYPGDITFICEKDSTTSLGDGTTPTGMERGRNKRLRPDSTLEAALFIAGIAWEKWHTSVTSLLREPKVVAKYGDYHLVKNRKEIAEMAENAIKTKFSHVFDMRFLDFKAELFKEPRMTDHPVLGRSSLTGLFGNQYGRMMSIEDSADVYIRLLEANCGDMGAKRFFLQLVAWFDRELGKKNAICLVGPSNKAKTWFCSPWFKIALFIGTISNPTRGESAPFSGITNSRVIFWDEADMGLEQTFADICKIIMGGQEASVNVKYQNRTLIAPAPILMCANRNPLRITTKADVDAINNRWWKIQWTATEKIINLIYGNCNPMCLFDVYEWATTVDENLSETDEPIENVDPATTSRLSEALHYLHDVKENEHNNMFMNEKSYL